MKRKQKYITGELVGYGLGQRRIITHCSLDSISGHWEYELGDDFWHSQKSLSKLKEPPPNCNCEALKDSIKKILTVVMFNMEASNYKTEWQGAIISDVLDIIRTHYKDVDIDALQVDAKEQFKLFINQKF